MTDDNEETPLVPADTDDLFDAPDGASKAFKAQVAEQQRLSAEAARPKPAVAEWSEMDAKLHGTDDPVRGNELKQADKERALAVDDISRLADACVHVKVTGQKIVPFGLKAFLLIRGFGFEESKSACEHFIQNGWWQFRERLFGEKPTK